MDGLRDRGLLDASGHLTEAGRATKARIEALTDALAEPPYEGLEPVELDLLIRSARAHLHEAAETGSQ